MSYLLISIHCLFLFIFAEVKLIVTNKETSPQRCDVRVVIGDNIDPGLTFAIIFPQVLIMSTTFAEGESIGMKVLSEKKDYTIYLP